MVRYCTVWKGTVRPHLKGLMEISWSAFNRKGPFSSHSPSMLEHPCQNKFAAETQHIKLKSTLRSTWQAAHGTCVVQYRKPLRSFLFCTMIVLYTWAMGFVVRIDLSVWIKNRVLRERWRPLTPLQLGARFWEQNHLELVYGGVLGL